MPEPLKPCQLAWVLKSVPLIREVRVLEETTSTNDFAMDFGRRGEPSGLVVFAERQTAGRGRLGRVWESQSGLGLWFSLLLRPKMPFTDWARLTIWAAVAVAEALETFVDQPAGIKWPNDIWFNGRKAVGILTETCTGNGDSFAVVGIGINVNHADFPPPLDQTATSLKLLTGKTFERELVAERVLRTLDARWHQLDGAFAHLIAETRVRNILAGKTVRLERPDGMVSGVAEDIADSGALLLRNQDGTFSEITSGEVTLCRTTFNAL